MVTLEFDEASSKLTAGSQEALANLCATVAANPELGVILGAGVAKGCDADLVARRVAAVREYLVTGQAEGDGRINEGRIFVRDELRPCRGYKSKERARVLPLLTFRLRDGERGQRQAIESYLKYYCWLRHDISYIH
jgi:hypothetical protein